MNAKTKNWWSPTDHSFVLFIFMRVFFKKKVFCFSVVSYFFFWQNKKKELRKRTLMN